MPGRFLGDCIYDAVGHHPEPGSDFWRETRPPPAVGSLINGVIFHCHLLASSVRGEASENASHARPRFQ